MLTTLPCPQFHYGLPGLSSRRARRLACRLALARRIAEWL